MPKTGIEIPNWINTIEYPKADNVEEFAYQIYLRMFLQNLIESEEAISIKFEKVNFTKLFNSEVLDLRSNFLKMKAVVFERDLEGQTAIWWSQIFRIEPAKGQKKLRYMIPQEKPFNHEVAICPNLAFSDDELFAAFKKALKEIRKTQAPFITSNWTNPSDESNRIINSVYCDPMSYLKKWESYKILHAVDLSILRTISKNKILHSQIVNRLGIGDESRYRKTTKTYMKEMMSTGVVEALLYALKHGHA